VTLISHTQSHHSLIGLLRPAIVRAMLPSAEYSLQEIVINVTTVGLKYKRSSSVLPGAEKSSKIKLYIIIAVRS